jgi:hypothetical protein
MNIRLNHKSEFYELFVNNRQIVFVLEEIRSIKIKKKLNFKYIICFLLLVSGFCLLVLQFFMFSFFWLSYFFIFSVLLFSEFIYKPMYNIELTIGADSFLFETLDNELYENFEMLKFFYDTKYNIKSN